MGTEIFQREEPKYATKYHELEEALGQVTFRRRLGACAASSVSVYEFLTKFEDAKTRENVLFAMCSAVGISSNVVSGITRIVARREKGAKV